MPETPLSPTIDPAVQTGIPLPSIRTRGMLPMEADNSPSLIPFSIEVVSDRKLTALQGLRRAVSGVCVPRNRPRKVTYKTLNLSTIATVI